MSRNIFVGLIMGFSLSVASAASFDCNKASNTSEKLICSNADLSELDDNLAQAFKNERSSSENPDQLKSDQLAWIKKVRECTDAKCIKDLYTDRISQLTKLPAIQAASTEAQKEIATITNTPAENQSHQLAGVSNNEPAATPTQSPSTSKSSDSSDIDFVTCASIALGISVIAAFISAAINQAITRSNIKIRNGNRAVRDIGAGLGALSLGVLLTLLPSWVIAIGILSHKNDIQLYAIYSSIAICISLFFGRIFAVKEGGIVYDSENRIIEVPGGGSSMDSILSYLNPIRWFEFLRRISIASDSITGISGETRFKTTTSYNKTTNTVNSNTSETHILTLITTDGEWNIKCGSRSKKSAMRTLVCEAANLS